MLDVLLLGAESFQLSAPAAFAARPRRWRGRPYNWDQENVNYFPLPNMSGAHPLTDVGSRWVDRFLNPHKQNFSYWIQNNDNLLKGLRLRKDLLLKQDQRPGSSLSVSPGREARGDYFLLLVKKTLAFLPKHD
jgi:hypothetical protein